MKLKKYRKKLGISQLDAAKQLGVTIDVYKSWEYNIRIPRTQNMNEIISWSKGKVTPNDFYLTEKE